MQSSAYGPQLPIRPLMRINVSLLWTPVSSSHRETPSSFPSGHCITTERQQPHLDLKKLLSHNEFILILTTKLSPCFTGCQPWTEIFSKTRKRMLGNARENSPHRFIQPLLYVSHAHSTALLLCWYVTEFVSFSIRTIDNSSLGISWFPGESVHCSVMSDSLWPHGL